jgi:PKD repeat protein
MKQLVLILFLAMQYGVFGQCAIAADFDYSISAGDINFTNTSLNEPSSPGYFWEYGGQTSSSENPTFIYSAGISSACLTVWDLGSSCSDTICISIADSSGCNLNLDWTESVSGGSITFTNTSTGEPTSASYAWLYGGQSSSMQHPVFTFDPAVTQVCFAINDLTGNSCDDSICGPVMVIDSCDINVSWTAVQTAGSIAFTNTSTNEPANPGYYWEYGGQTSSSENPTFIYSAGISSACLTVWDLVGSCSDTVCAVIVLDSTGCSLDVDFSYWIGTTTISFTDLSTGVPVDANYDWWYGSQNSAMQSPTFNLEAGNVYACLTVYDSLWTCYDSVCVSIDSDTAGGCNLNVDFTMTIDSGYVYFTNTSTGEPLDASYDWWYDSQSSTLENPSFALNDSGAWACLTVYDSIWDCYDSTCFFVEPASASYDDVEVMEVQLFPNPATSELNLTFTNMGAAEVMIYDASGRLVKQLYTLNVSGKLAIDVSSFEKGIYIINLIDSQTSSYITKRFVKL